MCSMTLPEMKLLKTLLGTQLKQINLKNQLYISTESPKEGFNDTVSQHFVNELKHCNKDMQMNLQLVYILLWLYSIYLVAMLSFRMFFFHNVFSFISFPGEFAIF